MCTYASIYTMFSKSLSGQLCNSYTTNFLCMHLIPDTIYIQQTHTHVHTHTHTHVHTHTHTHKHKHTHILLYLKCNTFFVKKQENLFQSNVEMI